jgi:hypothetical protein
MSEEEEKDESSKSVESAEGEGVDEFEDPEIEMRNEVKLLEAQKIIYSEESLAKVKLENQVMQKNLQNLSKLFMFLLQNRFGPRGFKEAKSYLDVIKTSGPFLDLDKDS